MAANKYDGFLCSGLSLGLTEEATQEWLTANGYAGWSEVKTLYPGLIKNFVADALPCPAPSARWAKGSPTLRFVSTADGFFLYRVDGFLEGPDSKISDDLEKTYGKALRDQGNVLRWARGGTTLNIGLGLADKMITFFHVGLADVADEQMAVVLDSKR